MRTVILSSFIIIISLLLAACRKGHTDISETRPLQELMAMMDKIPYNEPDTYIKVIQDSAHNKREIQQMCTYILDAGWRQTPQDYTLLADKIDKYFGKDNDTIHLYVLGYSGENLLRMGRVDTAVSVIKSCLDLAENQKDSALRAFAYKVMGDAYMMTNKYQLSTEMFYKAISYTPKAGEVSGLMIELANNHTRQHNLKDANIYMKKGVEMVEKAKDSAKIYFYSTQLASTYADLKNGDSTLWAAQKAYTIAKALKDSSQFATIYYYFGVAYRIKKDYNQSLLYSEKALALCQEAQDNWVLRYRINANIADTYLLMGELDKAESVYLEIVEEHKKRMGKRYNVAINDSLVVVKLMKMGEKELADRFRRVRISMDSTYTSDRISIREEMHTRYETAEKENKIQALALDKVHLQIQALLATILLLIGGIIAIWIIYRNQQQKLLLSDQNSLLKVEQERQVQALAISQQKLHDFSEHIISKNKLIEEMQVNMEALVNNTTSINNEEYEKSQAALVNMKILTERDWTSYLDYFEKVYPEYLKNVQSTFPNLTSGELRLIILLFMGFNRQEIMSILGISADGVRKNIYRLRKKLQLGENDDLETFVQSLNK